VVALVLKSLAVAAVDSRRLRPAKGSVGGGRRALPEQLHRDPVWWLRLI
jgi:hypothetical protein